MTDTRTAALGWVWSLVFFASSQAANQSTSLENTPLATVTVDAKHPWIDSGLTVSKNERLLFNVDGTIQWGARPDQMTGPEGQGTKKGKLGTGGLIGRVGYNGKPFPIGAVRTPIAMPKDGKLFLGINDFIFGDNSGAFNVRISRPRPST